MGVVVIPALNYHNQKVTNKVGPDVASLSVNAENRAKALGEGMKLRPVSM